MKNVLSPACFTQAVEAARQGPYAAGAATSRPWLRLAAFIAVAAALLVLAVFALVAAKMAAPGLIDEGLMVESAPQGVVWPLDREAAFLALLASTLMAAALVLLAAAMIVYQRGPGAFLWPWRGRQWGLLAVGFAVMAVLALLSWPLALLLEPDAVGPMFNAAEPMQARLTYAGFAALWLFIAAAAEEIAFRGVLLRITGGLFRQVWLICLVNGLLFSAIHFDPDPVAFVARALSGAVWTWAALRLGGIGFAVGAHWANNLFIALLIEPMSTAALPGRGIPVEYLALEVVTCAVVFVTVEVLARRRDRRDAATADGAS